MESSIWGSIKLVPIVYGLMAVISFLVAGIIKGLFAAVNYQTTRRAALAAAEAPPPGQPKTKKEG
jgi:hypothetical protein